MASETDITDFRKKPCLLLDKLIEINSYPVTCVLDLLFEDKSTTNYELAMSLLTYIDSAHDIGDGMNYIEDTDDVDAYKNVFKLIFDALGQIQHYNMMMQENYKGRH